MTKEQEEEVSYRISERLGILCEDRRPTVMQEMIARSDADAWLFADQCANGGGEF